VSLALRIFTLALVLGWQAVAVGALGPAHFCQRQVETRATECHCPHGAAKADTAPHDEPVLRMDCCDEPGWELPAPSFADVSSHSSLPGVLPAQVPAGSTLRPAEGARLLSLALWDTPQAQGPPVFLRVRSLLI
jgi:hypothetical protein